MTVGMHIALTLPCCPCHDVNAGTPGTGKTSLCERVAAAAGLNHINVGDWVKQHDLHSGFDAKHEAYIIDEDKVRWRLTDGLQMGVERSDLGKDKMGSSLGVAATVDSA